jgi:glucose dehydrogenase
VGQEKLLSLVNVILLVMRTDCGRKEQPLETQHSMDVNAARISASEREPGNWLTYGCTYSEQRFSPLKQIDDHNVAQLKLAWSYDLDTNRGQEATRLVVEICGNVGIGAAVQRMIRKAGTISRSGKMRPARSRM